ncbi:MAG: MOFRL family protein, partial [Bdellovibrionales bacterium]
FDLPEVHGLGGRSTHFVLSMAKILYKSSKNRNIKIMSFGTDGTDGPTDAAGAFIDYPMFTKLDCDDYLTDANSYEYFKKIDGLIKTGPTQTNVMDIRCIWNE